MMMRQLSAQDFVSIWESASSQPNYLRALTILGAALPGESSEQLAARPLGRRNALLFQARERVLGTRLNARSQCPACTEWLEFTLTAADLDADTVGVWDTTYQLDVDSTSITYRLPDTNALAAAAECRDAASARARLLEKCIVMIEPSGNTLTDAVVEALMDAINEHDPLAAIRLSIECPACQHVWTADFDILSYFWEEVVAQAKSLLVEVAALARGYGWSERDILSMSTTRRKTYLELLGV